MGRQRAGREVSPNDVLSRPFAGNVEETPDTGGTPKAQQSTPTEVASPKSAAFSAALRDPRYRLSAIAAVAVLVGVVVWLIVSSSGSGSSTAKQPAGKGISPVALSARGLATLASAVGQPIYWIGPSANTHYELTRTAEGKVYIRYLPVTTPAGGSGAFLTVGTYPMAGALAATKALSQKQGAVKIDVGKGGVGFATSVNATSAYAAYPGSNYQIEVYSPTPGAAVGILGSGRLVAVAPSASSAGTTSP